MIMMTNNQKSNKKKTIQIFANIYLYFNYFLFIIFFMFKHTLKKQPFTFFNCFLFFFCFLVVASLTS